MKKAKKSGLITPVNKDKPQPWCDGQDIQNLGEMKSLQGDGTPKDNIVPAVAAKMDELSEE